MRSIFFQKSTPLVLITLGLKKIWSGAVFAKTAPVKFQELPTPELPGSKGLRLKNKMCGICASDLHLVFVDVDPKVHPAALPGYDRIYLGHEVVSTVQEIGSEVQGLKVGDRVLMCSRFLGACCASQEINPTCSHCQQGNYALCENASQAKGHVGFGGGWGDGYTCHQSEVWKIPDTLSDEEATLLEPLACGVRAALRRPPQAGEKALVLGCGMIGLGTLQALHALDTQADIYAAARYPQQVRQAKSYGASVLESKDLLEETSKQTGAFLYKGDFGNRTLLGGFDVIYDCVGSEKSIKESLRSVRAGGTVVIVGVNLHHVKVDLTPIWHQEVNLVGSLAHGTENFNDQEISTFDLTSKWIQQGKIKTEGLITHRFHLKDWKQAIQTASNKKSGSLKVIFEYENEGAS